MEDSSYSTSAAPELPAKEIPASSSETSRLPTTESSVISSTAAITSYPSTTTSTSTSSSSTTTSTTSSTSTTPAVPEPPAAPEQPEYLKHCFYAEESLCQESHNLEDEARQDEEQTAEQAQNSLNTCHCKEHPFKPNSWYCCNITQMTMISSCSSKSKWINLHVRNMTLESVDFSNPIFRSLQSLAITDGNITRLLGAFPRMSALKCLNISNNNITDIPARAVKDVPHLEFFGMSHNNLSVVPHRNQNKNITLDIR